MIDFSKKHAVVLILVIGALLRLYKIDLDIYGWREADTAAMARNYYENGFRFVYPQIDWGGRSPGYVECEFPIYPYVVSLLYKLTGGVHEWIGRLLSVLFSLTAAYYLYLLVRKYVDSATAVWSCFFFLIVPMNLLFGRRFQAESLLLMSSILGVYFFSEWLAKEKWRYFLLSSFFITLAILVKIPSLFLGLPLLYLAWLKFKSKLLLQYSIWLYVFLVVVPVAVWYTHAHQIFLQSGLTFGIWQYGTDKWGNWGLPLSWAFWNRMLQSITVIHFAVFGFVLFIIGLFLPRKSPEERLFDFWILAVMVFFVIVAKGNYVHSYYQLPFMIPAVVYAGKTCGRFWDKKILTNKKTALLFLFLLGTLITGLWRYLGNLRNEERELGRIHPLIEETRTRIPEKALVISFGSNDPSLLYLSHRKGWVANPNEISESLFAERIRLGGRHILGAAVFFDGVSWKKVLEPFLPHPYRIVFDQDGSFIVKVIRSDRRGEDATCEIVSLPPQPWKTGRMYTVSIRVTNTGTNEWRTGDPSGPGYLLDTAVTADNLACVLAPNTWGITGVPVFAEKPIGSAESITMTFQIATPFQPGNYSFSWQLQTETGRTKRSELGSPTPGLCIAVER